MRTLLLLTGLLTAACAAPPPPTSARLGGTPVLIVHGLGDTPRRMETLRRTLARAGASHVRVMALTPPDGSVSLTELGPQVAAEADALLASTGAQQLDVVGFSMGALLARYYVAALGGRAHTRRLVAISGPQAGTYTAYLSGSPGALDMRPGSDFLRSFGEAGSLDGVEVTTIFSPLDVMILPASSSVIPGAHREVRIFVPIHGDIIRNGRVLSEVVRALGE